MDEHTKETLNTRMKCKLSFTDMLDALTDLFTLRGPPEYIRFDNGPEFNVQKVQAWVTAVGAKTSCMEPDPPWDNGCCVSLNSRFRDELLNGEIFYSLRKDKA